MPSEPLAALSETQAYLVLNALPGIGPVRVTRLLEAFGRDPRRVLAAAGGELRGLRGFDQDLGAVVTGWRTHFDLAREEDLMTRSGVRFVARETPDYPSLLAEIHDPPSGLYVKGNYRTGAPCVSIIGSRKSTAYGRSLARALAAGLARAGCCIVSGMARGIDTEAHEGALEAGGQTLAVLGTGIDLVYPPENIDLSKRILQSGGLVTEFPFGRRADRNSFAMRNRIVAGLSRVLVVVETDEDGGSMITARFASDQGRTVCAVPGRVDQSTSRGCHVLIRDGATLVCSAQDILEELGLIGEGLFGQAPSGAGVTTVMAGTQTKPDVSRLGAREQSIHACFEGGERLSVDQLVLMTGLDIPALSASLLLLEMAGLVHRRQDALYELC